MHLAELSLDFCALDAAEGLFVEIWVHLPSVPLAVGELLSISTP